MTKPLPRISLGHPTPWNGGSRSGSKLADGRHGRCQRSRAGRRSAKLQQVPQRDRSAHEQFVGRTCLAEVLADRVLARLGGTQAQQRRAVAARPGPAGSQAFEPDVGHFAPAAVPHLRADGLARIRRCCAIRPNRWNRIVCCNTWRTTRRAGCPAMPGCWRETANSWRSARERPSGSWASGSKCHYRNANIRIAVTAELLNRMMPKREPEYRAGQGYDPERAGPRPEPDGKRSYRADDPRSAPRPLGAGSQRRSGRPDPFDRRPRHVLYR